MQLLVAVAAALPSAHAASWTPFAPHGWLAVGTAANLLMLSFVDWEADAHLAGDFADPRRQLPRAMLAAFAIVAVLYLGLAVTTVAVLGGARGSTVPLADLMQRGLGGAASALTAGAAVLLTVGTTNAYSPARAAWRAHWRRRARCPAGWRGPCAAGGHPRVGATILGLLAAGLVDVDPIVRAISTCFVAVYVAATAAGVRLLDGRLRAAAALSLALVVVVLAFSGPCTSRRPRPVALLAGAFVSARAGGAAWREVRGGT